MFIDDIEHGAVGWPTPLPEGLSNLAVPVGGICGHVPHGLEAGSLSSAPPPLGVLAMGMMYRSGMSKMGDYYAAGQKMNNTIVEYINGHGG